MSGLSQSLNGYSISFLKTPDAGRNALCVLLRFNKMIEIQRELEYCPSGDRIAFAHSGVSVPVWFGPPLQFFPYFRVAAQIDDSAGMKAPSLRRTQYTLDLSNLAVTFSQLASPSSTLVSGNVILQIQDYVITPVTKLMP